MKTSLSRLAFILFTAVANAASGAPPIADRVQQNGGHVYPKSSRFFLLIDIKGDSKETYRILQVLLLKYSKMLSVVEKGKLREGAVTVVLTGNRPKLELGNPHPRYAG